jgi:Ca-activated chloride channel family protein
VGFDILFACAIFTIQRFTEGAMSDFRFENPGAFMLLWMIPVIYGLWRYFNKQALRRIQKGIDARLIPVLADSVSESKRRWKLRLQLIVVALMILAWARPQTSEGRVQVKNEGIEILLMVDVSNSMLSEDTRPSRLEVAKSELTRFVELSAGNRMALVAFAGSAVHRVFGPRCGQHTGDGFF